MAVQSLAQQCLALQTEQQAMWPLLWWTENNPNRFATSAVMWCTPHLRVTNRVKSNYSTVMQL